MAEANLKDFDDVEKKLSERRKAISRKLEVQFESINLSGLKVKMEKEGCLLFPKVLKGFTEAVLPRIRAVHNPNFLGWYKEGWKSSDFFYNTPGQPKVHINPSLRFLHVILSPVICTFLSSIVGSPVKMVQANVCRYHSSTNRCLNNHFDGCPFSAIVHLHATDKVTSGLHIQRNGKFDFVPTPDPGDLILIKGDKFLHRSCEVTELNERLVIVFFLEFSNPKKAKREAEEVTKQGRKNDVKKMKGTSSTENVEESKLKSKADNQRIKKPHVQHGMMTRRRKAKRVGYELEEADKLDTTTKDTVRQEKNLERAKRRRKQIRRKVGGGKRTSSS